MLLYLTPEISRYYLGLMRTMKIPRIFRLRLRLRSPFRFLVKRLWVNMLVSKQEALGKSSSIQFLLTSLDTASTTTNININLTERSSLPLPSNNTYFLSIVLLKVRSLTPVTSLKVAPSLMEQITFSISITFDPQMASIP
jgi:hypothetical protein